MDQDIDARLQMLLDRRDREFAEGVVEEIGNLNRELAALRRELSALADYQAMRDRILVLETAAASNVRLPRVAVVEPDQSLRPQDGFYGVEYSGGTIAFRWTGPSRQFTFDLYVDRTHGADLRLDALSCIDFDVQKDILLVADGDSIPVSLTPQEAGFVVTARLPSRKGQQMTNLVFIVPEVLMPPGSDDPRHLGIAFQHLSVVARNADSEARDEEAIAAASGAPDAEGAKITTTVVL